MRGRPWEDIFGGIFSWLNLTRKSNKYNKKKIKNYERKQKQNR